MVLISSIKEVQPTLLSRFESMLKRDYPDVQTFIDESNIDRLNLADLQPKPSPILNEIVFHRSNQPHQMTMDDGPALIMGIWCGQNLSSKSTFLQRDSMEANAS